MEALKACMTEDGYVELEELWGERKKKHAYVDQQRLDSLKGTSNTNMMDGWMDGPCNYERIELDRREGCEPKWGVMIPLVHLTKWAYLMWWDWIWMDQPHATIVGKDVND